MEITILWQVSPDGNNLNENFKVNNWRKFHCNDAVDGDLLQVNESGNTIDVSGYYIYVIKLGRHSTKRYAIVGVTKHIVVVRQFSPFYRHFCEITHVNKWAMNL